jgi:subtilase family serine protease
MRFGQPTSLLLLLAALLTGLLSQNTPTLHAQVSSSAHVPPEEKTAPDSAASTASVSSDIHFDRMILLLQPMPAQQKSLDTLLTAQQTPGSPQYHHWLTPAEFASRFAPTAADAGSVTRWLLGQGFTVAPLPASRGWVEFSGTVAQVQHAFEAKVSLSPPSQSAPSRYQIAGNVTIPSVIAANVAGLVSLDGTLSAAALTLPSELSSDEATSVSDASLSSGESMTPKLIRRALGFAATVESSKSGTSGSGEKIAIPVRSNVRQEDYAAFRKAFSLPDQRIEIDLSGADPGRTADEATAIFAASWAAGAAPAAQVAIVAAATTNATDGIDLALAKAIDGDLANTVSVGYASCENALSSTHRAFYSALYRQAAAEGIAVIAATGDSGAAACHVAGDITPVSTGYGVSALASTPWNTAIGAAAVSTNSDELTAWSPAGSTGAAYVSGGGASQFYDTPGWQSAAGVPSSDPGTAAAHHRYLPDIALPAAINNAGRGFGFCLSGDTGKSGCRLMSAGGSAASAALFSGVAALIAEKYGAQGNLAPRLYVLSGSQKSRDPGSQAFIDIIAGAALLPCEVGSKDCSEEGAGAGLIGFSAAPGYDLTSGLGGINVPALVADWGKTQDTGTEKDDVEMTTTVGVTYNPSATIALSAKVTSISGSSVPTGTVQFYDQTTTQNTGAAVTLAADGTASYTESGQFSVGGHNIEAIYSGDSTYEANTSLPVTINVQPSPTTLTVTPSTTVPAGGSTITVTGVVTTTNPGASPPSGTLTVNLDGIEQGTAPITTTGTRTSGSVTVTVPASGGHSVQGTYSGDVNYNQATSSSVTITVAKSSTVTTLAATPSTLTAGTPETLTATIAPFGTTTTAYIITGTVGFYDGTTLLGTATLASNTAVLSAVTLSASAVHTITAVYSGDTTYSTSTSSPLILQPVLLPVTVALTVSSSVLAPGQAANLTATVTPIATPALTAEQHPTGNVLFYSGTTLIGETALAAGAGNLGVATLAVPSVPAGSYTLTAVYAGDLIYGTAASNSVPLQVEDFTISCSLTNVNMVQGTTATVTCNVVSSGGLTGEIQVLCAEQNPPAVGAIQCLFTPSIINATGSTTLTIITTKGDIARSNTPGASPPARRGWPAAGGVALALVGLLLLPIGPRAGVLRLAASRRLVVVLLLAGLAGAGLGCGDTIKSNATNGGTPLGVATLKISAAANVNTVTVTHNAYITVDVTP